MQSQPIQENTHLQAVVFDWAGTVIDYGCMAPTAVFREAFARFDLDVGEEDVRKPMGLPKWDHIKAVLEMPHIAAEWKATHGKDWGDADVDALYEVFMPVQLDTVTRYTDPVPYLDATLELIRQRNLKIGSTTGYPRKVMEKVLPAAAAFGYAPESLVCGDDLSSGRPGPMMMLQTMVNLDVWPPQSIVKLDDTVPGIDEGRAAGCWTVGLSATGNDIGLNKADFDALDQDDRQARIDKVADKLTDAGADYVIEDLSGLPAVLIDIERNLQDGLLPDGKETASSNAEKNHA